MWVGIPLVLMPINKLLGAGISVMVLYQQFKAENTYKEN